MPLNLPRQHQRPSLTELRLRYANQPPKREVRRRRATLKELRDRLHARRAGVASPQLDLCDHIDEESREAAKNARRERLRRLLADMEASELAGGEIHRARDPKTEASAPGGSPTTERFACEMTLLELTQEQEPTHSPFSATAQEADEALLHPRNYRRSPLQINLAEWLDEVKWNLMVTLTFRHPAGVSKALAEQLFGRFLRKLREILVRRGTKNKIPMAAVVEDSREQLRELGLPIDGREGTHIHFLTRVRGGEDPYKYKEAIRLAWIATNRLCGEPRVYCPNSDKWFLPLTSDEMRRGFTGYILKHHGLDALGLLTQYLHFD